MTGFGESVFENDDLKLNISIRSLNSKNFDLRIKSNIISEATEMSIRKKLSKEIVRGKAECQINIEFKHEASRFSINKDVFKKYYSNLREIGEELAKPIDNFNFYEVIMHLPQTIESIEVDGEEYTELINKQLDIAVENFKNFRKQEGIATQILLEQYIARIGGYLNKIPNYEQERIERVKKRIKEAFESAKIDMEKERFEAELIYYLEKYDIQEEKNRLANHLDYFLETMAKEEKCGKKLGFIAQEMGREINTLGSKANHSEIQKLVVMMKDELEKIKEQVLNIL